MRLKHVKIQGYRSVKDLHIELAPFTVLLGSNNSGKSNVMRAIAFLLDPSLKIEDSDAFHPPGSQEPHLQDGTTIYVEGTFLDLTDDEKTTFKTYVSPDGEMTVRRQAIYEEGTWNIGYRGVLWEPNVEWMRSEAISSRRLTTRANLQDLVDSEPMAAPLQALLTRGGRITNDELQQEIEKLRMANDDVIIYQPEPETTNFMGVTNVAGGLLPEFLFLPAVRDLTDESATRTSASFGKLMRIAVQSMLASDPRVQRVSSDLEQVLDELNDRSTDEQSKSVLKSLESAIEEALGHWNEIQVRIQVDAPSIEQVFNLGSHMMVDDGVETPALQKGHGLQRALIFALMRTLSNQTRISRPTSARRGRRRTLSLVYGIEEPEISLHPHAQRRLARDLRSISEDGQSQVIVTTHANEFIDIGHYEEIGILSINRSIGESLIRQCTHEIFNSPDRDADRDRFRLSEWIDAARGELFFSKLVVLVEGPTEKAILPMIAERLQADISEVSVIDCAGKWNLPAYVHLLNEFQIPYLIVHDEDPVRNDPEGDKLRSARELYEFNSDIACAVDQGLGDVEMVTPDFERACGVSRSAGKRLGKPFAGVQHLDELSDERLPKVLCDIVSRIEEMCSAQ